MRLATNLLKSTKLFTFLLFVLAVIAVSPEIASAFSSGGSGVQYPGSTAEADVSANGTYAVTNNPQSWFNVTASTPKRVSVKVDYTCKSNGRVGFQVWDQQGNLLQDDSNVCNGYSGTAFISSTSKIFFNIPNQTDPDGLYYEHIYVQVVDKGSGGHLPFQITVYGGSDTFISYAADAIPKSSQAGGSFIAADNDFGVFTGGMAFDFQPPCNWNGGAIYLKWSGADNGSISNPNQPYSMNLNTYLQDLNTGKIIWSMSGPALGTYGDSSIHENARGIPVTAGHRYRWGWNNVSGNNEIALSVPFTSNSFDDGVICKPPPPPTGKVGGTVYEVDPNGNFQGQGGVTVFDCNGQYTTTNSAGKYSFTEIDDKPFCLRIVSGTPWGFQGPFTRPWGSSWIPSNYLGCGPFNGFYYGYCTPGNSWACQNPSQAAAQLGCPYQSYEWQWSHEFVWSSNGNINCSNGSYKKGGGCSSLDRNDSSWDKGYDFVYDVSPPIGNVDQAICGPAGVAGWSFDPSTPTDTNWVTGAYDSPSNYFFYIPANGYRPDVGAVYPMAGDFHGFQYPLTSPALTDGNNHLIYVYGNGIGLTGADDGMNSQLGSSPKLMIGCKPFSYNPVAYANVTKGTNENPGQITFGAQTNLSLTPPPSCPIGTTLSYNIYKKAASGAITGITSGTQGNCIPNENDQVYQYTPPPGSFDAGDQFCIDVTINPGSGYVEANGTIEPGAGGPVSNTQCMTIVNEPYFKVFNSGVSATGGAIGASATCNGGQLTSWNDDSGLYPGYGAGAELSALATGSTAGFGSALSTSSFNAGQNPGQGLSFANINTGGAPVQVTGNQFQDTPNMGCNFNSSFCYSVDTTGLPTTPYTAPNLSAASSGRYIDPPGSTIKGGNISPGTNITIYVNGNVYITPGGGGGINYTGSSWSWQAGNNKLPTFALVSIGGNIYIDPGVTNLDGMYIAEKSGGSGGNIYDCATGPSLGSVANTSNMWSMCNNQLTVHGYFVADNVDLARTFGSLRDEQPAIPPVKCSNQGSWGTRYSCAGEVFEFSPELYLGNYLLTPSNNQSIKYDSYTSLPPVL